MCLQGLSGQNHVGIPVRAHRGCALTCALKNRAYGASVPAGGVCLQGQFYGTNSDRGAIRLHVGVAAVESLGSYNVTLSWFQYKRPALLLVSHRVPHIFGIFRWK